MSNLSKSFNNGDISKDLLQPDNFLSNLDTIIPESDTSVGATIGLDMLNPNNFTDIKDEDKYEDKPEYYFKKATSRGILKANYKLALAIDPSQNGSGFAIYDNRWGTESLFLESSSLSKIKDTKEDPLNYFKMQKEFSQDLLEALSTNIKGFTEGKIVFDLVIIEDTVFNNGDPQIFKRLVLINHVVDHLIASGVIKTDTFLRVNNKVWKKFLFSYKTGKQYLNVKREIEETLLYLQEPLVLENYDKKPSWKKNSNYQDKLDAISMLITGQDVKEYYKIQASGIKKVNYRYKLLIEKPAKGTEIELSDMTYKSLLETIKQLKGEKVKNKYFIKVKRGQLGNFGIKNDLIFPLGVEVAYLYLY